MYKQKKGFFFLLVKSNSKTEIIENRYGKAFRLRISLKTILTVGRMSEGDSE